ncbi:MAG TPA: SDR family NAD(P)-dependent oxidoreductase [Usitatibacter sp.]|jgi:NAD(P)-dependent dehydrogenase (short-subunit alcohol dehydrogenase family)|nr:SDR family NAD(P)-dependent oxidoreductase [Usitatibacter sp.]
MTLEKFPRERYEPAPDLLAGRVILVTGAGQGLGRAVALACAAHGATLALLGRKQEKLEATYDAICAANGPEPALVPLDLATAGGAELDALAALVRRDLKRLDGIVHCASHFAPLGPLADESLERWLETLRVNLAAPFALTRACLPLLNAAPAASVIFTGETHGVHPRAYWGGFAVAKAGLSTLAAIWADELEHAGKPRINVLVPGPIASPQRSRSHPGEDRSKLRTPEEAANAFLFLLGDEAHGLSGRTFEL